MSQVHAAVVKKCDQCGKKLVTKKHGGKKRFCDSKCADRFYVARDKKVAAEKKLLETPKYDAKQVEDIFGGKKSANEARKDLGLKEYIRCGNELIDISSTGVPPKFTLPTQPPTTVMRDDYRQAREQELLYVIRSTKEISKEKIDSLSEQLARANKIIDRLLGS